MQKIILLIEDNNSLRYTLSELLFLEGYEVLALKGEFLAIKQAIQKKYDLIICSRSFSDCNCFQVFQELSKNILNRNTPFILLSSIPLGKLHERIGQQERTFILNKPFENQDLLKVVYKLLYQKNMTLIKEG